MNHAIKTEHKHTYKHDPQAAYFSPGVMNLLGTHAERQGGKVLGLTHDIGLTAVVSARLDRMIQIRLLNEPDTDVQTLNLETLHYDTIKSHAALMAVLLKKLSHEGYDVSKGLDITVGGPLRKENGIGFESTLLMLFFSLVMDQNALTLEKKKQLRYATHVFKEFKPTMSAPTDPLALLYAKQDHLIYICGKTMDFDWVPFDFQNYALTLFNTNRNPEHSLKTLMKRQNEVHDGFTTINRKRVIESLCDLDVREFNTLKELISKPTTKKRIEHVVFEGDRSRQGFNALERGDYILFSGLIEQSHISLKELYEVSGEELDFLASEAYKQGALAGKLAGVGFGGPLIALFEKDDLPRDFDDLKHRYEKRFHKPLDVTVLKSESVVRKIDL